MNKEDGNTLIKFLEIISKALSLTWLFVRTIGITLLTIYLIYYSFTESFDKSYKKGMYLGIGIVTFLVGMIQIAVQYYLIKQTQSQFKIHEKQFDKKTNQN